MKLAVPFAARGGNNRPATVEMREKLAAIAEAATVMDRRTRDINWQTDGVFIDKKHDGPITLHDDQSGDTFTIRQTVPLAIKDSHVLHRASTPYDGGKRYKYSGIPKEIVGITPVYESESGGKTFSGSDMMSKLWALSDRSWREKGHGLSVVGFTKPSIVVEVRQKDGTFLSLTADPMKSGPKGNEPNAVHNHGKPRSKWDAVEVGNIYAAYMKDLDAGEKPPEDCFGLHDPDSGIGIAFKPLSLRDVPDARNIALGKVDRAYTLLAKQLHMKPGTAANHFEYTYSPHHPHRDTLAFQYRHNLGEYNPDEV